MIALASAGALAETPTFDMQTGMLELPVVEVHDQGINTHFEVKFKATPDLSGFNLVYAEPVSLEAATNLQLEGLSGEYSGSVNSYLPGTQLKQIDPFTPNCSGFPFSAGSADLDVSIEEEKINLTHSVFGSTDCQYTGTINGTNIGGTYQCSDFTTGTWTLNTLRPTSTLGDSITAHISLTGESC